jgi:hypothetical protein
VCTQHSTVINYAKEKKKKERRRKKKAHRRVEGGTLSIRRTQPRLLVLLFLEP